MEYGTEFSTTKLTYWFGFWSDISGVFLIRPKKISYIFTALYQIYILVILIASFRLVG